MKFSKNISYHGNPRSYFIIFWHIALTALICFSSNSLAYPDFQIHVSPLSSMMNGRTVTAVFEDSNGFLWIGTQNGLYKFDGARLKYFSASARGNGALSSSDVRGIEEDANGNIVLATYGGGLLIWDSSKGQFVKSRSISEDSEYLTAISKDSLGNFLVSSETDTLILDRTLKRARSLSSIIPKAEGVQIAALSQKAPSKAALLGVEDKLFILDISEGSAKKLELPASNENISALTDFGSTRFIIGTDEGKVSIIDKEIGRIMASLQHDEIGSFAITALAVYQNRIWVGTNRGLLVTDKNLGVLHHFTEENSPLTNNHITTVSQVGRNLIIGNYNGLNQVSPAEFELYNTSNSGVYNDVMSIEEDMYGDVWIGTFGGLFKRVDDDNSHKRLALELPDQRIMSIEAVGEKLWMGLWQDGVFFLDLSSGVSFPAPYPELAGISVTNIYGHSDGKLWVATYGQGVLKVEDNRVSAYTNFANRPILAFAETNSGSLYAISDEQLYRYDHVADDFLIQNIDYPNGVQNLLLFTLSIGQNDVFRLGTKDHGLFEISVQDSRANEFDAIRVSDDPDLLTSSVYAAIEDRDSNLWLATDNGVASLDKNGALRSRFNTANGLQGNDFNFGAFLFTKNERVFLGGPNGYNVFRPRDIYIESAPSKISIPFLQIGNGESLEFHEISSLEELRLAHTNYSITIHLGILDFTAPSRNIYSHTLENFDDSWINDGNDNVITYTNIPPGSYVFRARGADSRGMWSKEDALLHIVVLPPWWLTWWAYILYLILAMTVLWGGLRFYRANLLKEAALALADEMQDTADRAQDDLQESQDLQDELVRAVYQHNLTTLELIGKCIAASVDGGDSHPKLMDHLKAMELLEESYYFQGGQLMADLRSYVDRLSNHLLPQSTVAAATITTINLTTSEMLPARVASPVAIILYELVANALEHAFSSDVAAHYLEIKASLHYDQDDSFLSLSVADDGIGLPGTFTLGQSSELSGLFVVKSLVDSLSGTIQLSTSGETRFDVSLPISH